MRTSESIAKAAGIEAENRRGWRPSAKKKIGKSYDTVEEIFTPGRLCKYLVSIDDHPITFQEFKALTPRMRYTAGAYTIRYIPRGSYERTNPKTPYLIGQDLIRMRILVSGPQHWKALGDRIPELGWLRRNSTMTDEFFAIAKKHPGLTIRFGIDYPKYCATIESRAEELGLDIDHKPLVLYAQPKDRMRIPDSDEPIRTRSKEDVLSEIEEAAAEAEEEHP